MPKILLIDDEKELLEEVSDWLQFEGYEVVCAENGRIGLELALQAPPDLIVCDIAMPEMDGRTVLLEVRANANLYDVPFIFLTASIAHEAIRIGMNLGADDYLTKPVRHRELLHSIESRLRKQTEQQQIVRLQLEAVQQAFQEEQQRHLLKSRLVAMFSHDFRNPLLTILSAAELLDVYGDRVERDRHHKYLQRIGGAAQLLLQMLDDLLTVAQIENGHLEYRPEPLEIARFLADIVDEFKLIYGDSYAFISEMLFADTVLMDPKLLRQIVTNLLSNAVKYSSSGSTVTVRLAPNTAGYVLQVIDQGVGIAQNDLANLFEPFYRVEQLKAQKGTGLGLTIVREAAQLCGATIAVDSVIGQGSCFALQFPPVSPDDVKQSQPTTLDTVIS